jgi:hypothetical protein
MYKQKDQHCKPKPKVQDYETKNIPKPTIVKSATSLYHFPVVKPISKERILLKDFYKAHTIKNNDSCVLM